MSTRRNYDKQYKIDAVQLHEAAFIPGCVRRRVNTTSVIRN